MANGTLPEVIEFIRHTGIYGPEMREAIARAIELVDTDSDGRITQIHNEVLTDNVRMTTTLISGTTADYLLTITNPS